ncbi:MAG: hypothetical protein JWM72_4602 [Actinomycetia bacterium]|nr:hypothetical protein [Actinomycetes bacterium]
MTHPRRLGQTRRQSGGTLKTPSSNVDAVSSGAGPTSHDHTGDSGGHIASRCDGLAESSRQTRHVDKEHSIVLPYHRGPVARGAIGDRPSPHRSRGAAHGAYRCFTVRLHSAVVSSERGAPPLRAGSRGRRLRRAVASRPGSTVDRRYAGYQSGLAGQPGQVVRPCSSNRVLRGWTSSRVALRYSAPACTVLFNGARRRRGCRVPRR